MAVYALGELQPTIDATAFVHPEAVIIGDVTIGAQSSIWPGAVLRGDGGGIRIGDRTSVQDNAVLHTTPFWETVVGNDCVLGHLIHLEGCTIEDEVLIGNASMVLHRSVIRSGAIVAANSVVLADVDVPTGALAVGLACGDQTWSGASRGDEDGRPLLRGADRALPHGPAPSRLNGLPTVMWALVVTVAPDEVEVAADTLWSLGVRAVEERTAAGPSDLIELWTHVGDGVAGYERAVAALAGRWPVRREFVDETPSDAWRDHAAPMRIDDELVIVPAWLTGAATGNTTRAAGDETGDGSPSGLVVAIDPGGAFGLGDHPTTVLSLRALRRVISPGDPIDVLDVGCGTGVIAVVAAKMLARRVRAVDVASSAVEATGDNARRNGVEHLVIVDETPLSEIADDFDVVVANILAPTLVELADDLRRVTRPAGRLVISGVLDGRFDHVVAALSPMEVERTDIDRGWAAVTLRHAPTSTASAR